MDENRTIKGPQKIKLLLYSTVKVKHVEKNCEGKICGAP
jgi:hypothetical protein